jgi:chemotaxis protein CheD
LGSCVAACLYDPFAKIIGMNHFLLSNRRYAKDLPLYVTESGRYGVHAMELLINEMMKLGAKRHNLRAKAFGGGTILQQSGTVGNFFCVGEVNCKFIKEFLDNERIPLVTSDLGGTKGRVVHFSNGDFAVYVRKIDRTRSERLATRDRSCWQKAIEIQEHTLPTAEIWS